MAFVISGTPALRSSTFTASTIDRRTPVRAASRASPLPRIVAEATPEQTKEPGEVGVAGKSMWKENYFAGGFPGGEAFYRAWVDDGMKADVPDMPSSMQPKTPFKPTKVEKRGVLARLDATEFFKNIVSKPSEDPEAAAEEEESATVTSLPTPVGAAGVDATPSDIVDTEVPSESLYEKYFPKAQRYIAPDIIIDYDKKSAFNRVGVAMTPVTASYADIYFPEWIKNKAPIIEIKDTGSYGGRSVTVRFGDVEPLPTLAAPPKKGEVVTSLSAGSSGGLKISYDVYGDDVSI